MSVILSLARTRHKRRELHARDPLRVRAFPNLYGPKAMVRYPSKSNVPGQFVPLLYHMPLQDIENIYFPPLLVQVMLKPELLAPVVGIP
jgi:hypothetical protein